MMELNELFKLYWRQVVPLGQTSIIAFPFSRLACEPFWKPVPQSWKRVEETKSLLAAGQGGRGGSKPNLKACMFDRLLGQED